MYAILIIAHNFKATSKQIYSYSYKLSLNLLQAGWKLWPFAHLITYGLVPVEQRLLWVDCVEIIWVTILSMFSNEKSQKRLESGEGEAVLVLSDEVVVEETVFTKDSQ